MFDTLLALLSRLSGTFRRRRAEQEFDDEIAQHLDLLAQDYIRRGMSPQEARTAARRTFGGVAQAREKMCIRDSLSCRRNRCRWV